MIEIQILLASGSPRRRQLLSLTGWPFTVAPAEVDETPHPDEQPQDYTLRLAKAKAARLQEMGVSQPFILAADTTVADGDTLLGKPADSTEARRMLRRLRGNEIICIIADEYKRHGGVTVPFFGHPVPTAPGPALLALRTGAALLPLFVVRQPDDTHRVIIDPPLEHAPTGDRDADVRALTALFTGRIEHYIRSYPDQWWWLNRRWKGISRGDKHYRG